MDEAIALPTDFSARIARNTQLYLQHEIGVTQFIDPTGGSFYIEYLTEELIEKAEMLIQEVEDLGGMALAIEKGVPKMRIEESAAKKQAQIDSVMDVIVGVNRFTNFEESTLELRDVDNTEVLKQQLIKLKEIKENRDNDKVDALLKTLQAAAKDGKDNLLELAIKCALARCTLGEISDALENEFGRYQAKINTISGVYEKLAMKNEQFIKAKELCNNFASLEGRRPRILIAKMGQDGHDRGAKIIATAFADIGFDVDMGPLFQTPEEVAKQAIENDVHIVGVSSLAAGHKTLVPALIKALKDRNRKDILVVVGGVIPKQDYAYLKEEGVFGIYGPGTVLAEAAQEILSLLLSSHN